MRGISEPRVKCNQQAAGGWCRDVTQVLRYYMAIAVLLRRVHTYCTYIP